MEMLFAFLKENKIYIFLLSIVSIVLLFILSITMLVMYHNSYRLDLCLSKYKNQDTCFNINNISVKSNIDLFDQLTSCRAAFNGSSGDQKLLYKCYERAYETIKDTNNIVVNSEEDKQ